MRQLIAVLATPKEDISCYTTQRRLILSFPAPTARAIAYSEPSCCSDGLQTGRTGNDVDERRTPIGLDFVRRTVMVEVRELVSMNDSVDKTSLLIVFI